MKILKHFVIILLFTFCNNTFAQILDLDEAIKIEFKTGQDFEKFEDQIIEYINWLDAQPLGHPDRKKVNAIIFKWLEGTPKVMVSIMPYITDYAEKNPGFLTMYLGGWIKFALENPAEKSDELKANLAGVNSILDYYEKGKKFDVNKDKKMEKLLKKRKSGKLEKFIAKKIGH